ncbi:hypothetical protein [Deinococcus marmoris]|nr:hypothetical protein [Deinococcus marmoris]
MHRAIILGRLAVQPVIGMGRDSLLHPRSRSDLQREASPHIT